MGGSVGVLPSPCSRAQVMHRTEGCTQALCIGESHPFGDRADAQALAQQMGGRSDPGGAYGLERPASEPGEEAATQRPLGGAEPRGELADRQPGRGQLLDEGQGACHQIGVVWRAGGISQHDLGGHHARSSRQGRAFEQGEHRRQRYPDHAWHILADRGEPAGAEGFAHLPVVIDPDQRELPWQVDGEVFGGLGQARGEHIVDGEDPDGGRQTGQPFEACIEGIQLSEPDPGRPGGGAEGFVAPDELGRDVGKGRRRQMAVPKVA